MVVSMTATATSAASSSPPQGRILDCGRRGKELGLRQRRNLHLGVAVDGVEVGGRGPGPGRRGGPRLPEPADHHNDEEEDGGEDAGQHEAKDYLELMLLGVTQRVTDNFNKKNIRYKCFN